MARKRNQPSLYKAKSILGASTKRLDAMAGRARIREEIAAAQWRTDRYLNATDDGYEAAQSGRTRRRYHGTGGSADKHLDAVTLFQLREMARRLDRSSSLMSGLLDTAAQQILGPTFEFKATTRDTGYNKAVKQWIDFRMEPAQCHHAGEMGFWEYSRTAFRAIWTDGDLASLWTAGGGLQAAEADQLVSPQKSDSRHIVNGIEKDATGRTIAYHIKKRGTKSQRGFVLDLDSDAVRVPAELVQFWAYKKRFSQTRGVPYLAACLGVATRFHEYLDSESLAAEINSKAVLKITRDAADDTAMPGQDSYTDPNQTSDSVSTFEALKRVEAGEIFDLRPGEDVDVVGLKRPGDTFEPYVITAARITGVGVGLPLELFLMDFSRTNYSSARASLGLAQRGFQVWQRMHGLHLALPWYRRQLAIGVATGAIDAREEMYRAVRTIYPPWPHVDLYKEMQAREKSIAMRTNSRSEFIRMDARDPDEVFDEIEAEEKRFGPPASDPGPNAAEGADAAGKDDPDDADDPDKDDREEDRDQGRTSE